VSARPPIFALATVLLAGCPHFQPDVAVRPAPYDAASAFALTGAVEFHPELDDHRISTDESTYSLDMRTDPRELAATPALVAQCVTETAVASHVGHAILPPGVAHADAFSLTLTLVVAVPGWTRGAGDALSAQASVPGATVSASAGGVAPSSGAQAYASAIVEIHAQDGTLVDRVRIFAQRFPHVGEPLDARTHALCVILLDETQHYLDWRLAGNG